MEIAFDKKFAGREVGRVEDLPDRMADLLIRKGYATATGNEPVKKLVPRKKQGRPKK